MPTTGCAVRGERAGPGEIGLCGPPVMAGHHRRPAVKARALRGDGYFPSGDEGVWRPGPGS